MGLAPIESLALQPRLWSSPIRYVQSCTTRYAMAASGRIFLAESMTPAAECRSFTDLEGFAALNISIFLILYYRENRERKNTKNGMYMQ